MYYEVLKMPWLTMSLYLGMRIYCNAKLAVEIIVLNQARQGAEVMLQKIVANKSRLWYPGSRRTAYPTQGTFHTISVCGWRQTPRSRLGRWQHSRRGRKRRPVAVEIQPSGVSSVLGQRCNCGPPTGPRKLYNNKRLLMLRTPYGWCAVRVTIPILVTGSTKENILVCIHDKCGIK